MTSPAQIFAGRKRESGVWDYFQYFPGKGKNGKSRCLVINAKGKECGTEIAGKNPTNLKSHMSKIHKTEYAELEESETARKKQQTDHSLASTSATTGLGVQTLREFLSNRGGVWSAKSAEYEERITAVLRWIISTGCPMTYIDVPEFKMMLNTCDRKFIVPGKAVISIQFLPTKYSNIKYRTEK